MAQIRAQTKSTAGCGLLLVAIIIAVLFTAVLGPLGIALGGVAIATAFVAGLGSGRTYTCGGCSNPVASKGVKLCPVCGEALSPPSLMASGNVVGGLIIGVAVLFAFLSMLRDYARRPETVEPTEAVETAAPAPKPPPAITSAQRTPPATRPAERPNWHFADYAHVRKDGIAHSGPSADDEAVMRVVAGETYRVLAKTDGWAQIETEFDEFELWLSDETAEVTRELLTPEAIALLVVKQVQAAADAKVRDRCKLHGVLNSSEYAGTSMKINVWDSPEKRRVEGQALPGSPVWVLMRRGEAVKILSPLDGSVGWISNVQFDDFVYQDTKTGRPCTP